MAGKTNYWEKVVLNLAFRTQAAMKPPAIYIALFITSPTDVAGSGVEVSGTGYARIAIPQADAQWTASGNSPSQIVNANPVQFGSPLANWGTIVAWAATDAVSGGNRIYWNTLLTPKTVNSLDAAPSFPAGSLIITED